MAFTIEQETQITENIRLMMIAQTKMQQDLGAICLCVNSLAVSAKKLVDILESRSG
jgi:hypothetical protein